jgi:hypothetical protein
LVAARSGVLAIRGGVKPWSKGKVRNQFDEEICWSYTLNEFADKGGKNNSSPEHNGFWHIYFQFSKHQQYFDQLRKKVRSGKISKRDAIKEVNLMFRLRKGSATARKAGFVVDAGSDETTALLEAGNIGFVDNSLFDHKLRTAKQANDFQAQLSKLITQFLSNDTKLKTYQVTDKYGINDDLYDLLVERRGINPFALTIHSRSAEVRTRKLTLL